MLSPDDETRRTRILRHLHETRCYLVADHAPCVEVAARQQAANRVRRTPNGAVGRDIVPLAHADFARVELPTSWLAVVLLCADDDLMSLVAWARRHREAVDRIHFFCHAELEPTPLLRSWAEEGLPMPRIGAFQDQRHLNAPLGRLINRYIDADHGGLARRPPV